VSHSRFSRLWYLYTRAWPPCRAIAADEEKVYEYTNKWNSGVVSDGTRFWAWATSAQSRMPSWREALLFKYLVAWTPWPFVSAQGSAEIIQFVKWLQPSFAGSPEELSQPKCFRILDTLREECGSRCGMTTSKVRHGEPGAS